MPPKSAKKSKKSKETEEEQIIREEIERKQSRSQKNCDEARKKG
jgi:hypothetical protein